MANFVYIATSLDGYIAKEDGNLEWLESIPNPEQNDYGYKDFISGIDAIVMGRKTFEKVLTFGFWPYEKPVFVLSRYLTEVPDFLQGKIEFIKGDPGILVDRLNQRGLKNLYIDGGETIQGFLREDLIDEMIISLVPILLGRGISLFGSLDKSLAFKLKKSASYNSLIVKNHYIRAR